MEQTPPRDAAISDELKEELRVYEVLKPYIGHCLTINHDINNPLSGITGYAEFLLEEADSFTEEQKYYLTQIMQCAERIQKLVENLCDEKIALSEKIDLRPVVDAYTKCAKRLD